MQMLSMETDEVLYVQLKLILFALEALQHQKTIVMFDQQDYMQILLKLSVRLCEEMD